MPAFLSVPQIWLGFFTLLILEIVLGVDNVIFISILSGKLPEHQRKKAWQLGLGLAMFLRLALLASISWIMTLKAELFNIMGHSVSGKELILLLGGLFLIYKATKEIHDKLEGEEHTAKIGTVTFAGVITQILILDLVFSLDSVITAVGMVKEVAVMVAAIVIAVGIMLFLAQHIADFVHKHPTVKMLALAFLVLIGVTLIAEGTGSKIPKGYVYFAMAFSVGVEMLNLAVAKKKKGAPVKLKSKYEEEAPAASSGDPGGPSNSGGH
jgi:predicted tellurium resistance membrane protein TerC